MRKRFNELDLNAMTPKVIEDDPAPEWESLQPSSRSQRVEYSMSGTGFVAEVHRYLQPDGTLGGSGKPDPKILAVDGEEWRSCHDDEEACIDCPPRSQQRWLVDCE